MNIEVAHELMHAHELKPGDIVLCIDDNAYVAYMVTKHHQEDQLVTMEMQHLVTLQVRAWAVDKLDTFVRAVAAEEA